MTDINRPLLGEPNAPCRSCGSPLAADQRYCLQCGARRAEARLPFLDILARQVPAAAPDAASATTTTSTRWFGRLSTNAAAVAGVACLLLALGVGVLIGGLGQDDSAASSGTPQVISVGGGAAAPAVAATSAAPAATETTTDDATTTTAKGTKKAKSKSSSSKATNNAVKKLDSSSGGDYSKKSAKLPKTLGTGGKAPAIDKSGTKIGGGSDTEEIG